MTDLIIGFTLPAIVAGSRYRQLQTAPHWIISATENNISRGALGWKSCQMGGPCCNVKIREEWGGWGGGGGCVCVCVCWGGPWHEEVGEPLRCHRLIFQFFLEQSCCHACLLRPTLDMRAVPFAEDELFPKGARALSKVGMSPLPWQPPSHTHTHTHTETTHTTHTHTLLLHSSSGSLSDHYLHNYMLSSEEKTNPQILRVNKLRQSMFYRVY